MRLGRLVLSCGIEFTMYKNVVLLIRGRVYIDT